MIREGYPDPFHVTIPAGSEKYPHFESSFQRTPASKSMEPRVPNFPLAVFLLLLSLRCFSSTAAPPEVRLGLYYESLCPYCSRFMVNYLPKIFTNGLIEIVDLELVPYGNARVGPNGTITCQHGSYECLLNTVEACAISTWPELTEHFRFIYCVEQLVVEHKYTEWESCFQKLGLNAQPVLDCFNGANGKKLELQYAAQTDALEPPHTYVPWVVVDGQPLYEDYENFETYICKAYHGDLPKACEDLLLVMTPKLKTNEAGHVSYANKAVMLSVVQSSTT